MAALLTNAHCTVTLCHSRTRDLAEKVSRADLIVSAVGRAGIVKSEWLKPGVIVVDVGMSRDEEGHWFGDVEAEGAQRIASAMTPVPGGVGPMTVCMLIVQTLAAGRRRRQS